MLIFFCPGAVRQLVCSDADFRPLPRWLRIKTLRKANRRAMPYQWFMTGSNDTRRAAKRNPMAALLGVWQHSLLEAKRQWCGLDQV